MVKIFLFYLAVAGWLLSLFVNTNALQGVDLTVDHGYVWLLHVGIFIVWLPAVLELRKNEELKQLKYQPLKDRFKPFATYNIMFKGTPLWIKALICCCSVYAFVTFFYFNFYKGLTGPAVHNISGSSGRGGPSPGMLASFSAIWLLFYGVAAGIQYPYKDSPGNESTDPYNIKV